MASSQALSDEIEHLLEQYLNLLNTYTTLRAELNTAQSSVYQNLARANFHAERGTRYGQDAYDARPLQPGRTCRITPTSTATPTPTGVSFEVLTRAVHGNTEDDVQKASETEDERARGKGKREKEPSTPDPLRMFGFAVPSALRVAQAEARAVVDRLVPALLDVDQRMKELEICIRRARKRRGKLELEEKAESGRASSSLSGQDGLGRGRGVVVE